MKAAGQPRQLDEIPSRRQSPVTLQAEVADLADLDV